MNGLNAWCTVTVLRLLSCGLGEGGGRALAETLCLNSTLTSLDLGENGLGEGWSTCWLMLGVPVSGDEQDVFPQK